MVRGSKKGYINKFLFAEYGKRLIYHLHAADQLDKPNLILMDSHYSHVFNYCFMKMMFDKDIKVMALEAHSSYYSQPLDKNPFSSFKMEFNNQMKKFNRTSGERAIIKAEFFPVFNLAWNRSLTAEKMKAGFKRTGIWPPDSDALPDYLFAVNKQSESSGSDLELKELVQLYFCVQMFTVGPVNNFYQFTLQTCNSNPSSLLQSQAMYLKEPRLELPKLHLYLYLHLHHHLLQTKRKTITVGSVLDTGICT